MRYIVVERIDYGMAVDPAAYLRELPGFVDALPTGARAFATDPAHYDFFGQRCIKDLKPLSLTAGDHWVELRLGHNCWKHEEDLTIRYSGVRSVATSIGVDAAEVAGLRDV